MSPRTIDAAKARGDLPFYRVGSRKVLFRRADLDRWLAGMRVDVSATPAAARPRACVRISKRRNPAQSVAGIGEIFTGARS